MRRRKMKLTIVLGLVVITSTGVNAHMGASGIVKQRMDAMSEMGDAMKAMGDMVKGKQAFVPETITGYAEVLEKHSGTLLDYFPDTDESRHGKETEALPKIWESWERFEELSNKFVMSVSELKKGAANGLDKRSFRILYSKTAKSCSSCHDDYRRPKE